MDVGLWPSGLRSHRTRLDKEADAKHKSRLLVAYATIRHQLRNPIKAAAMFRALRKARVFRS